MAQDQIYTIRGELLNVKIISLERDSVFTEEGRNLSYLGIKWLTCSDPEIVKKGFQNGPKLSRVYKSATPLESNIPVGANSPSLGHFDAGTLIARGGTKMYTADALRIVGFSVLLLTTVATVNAEESTVLFAGSLVSIAFYTSGFFLAMSGHKDIRDGGNLLKNSQRQSSLYLTPGALVYRF